MLRRSTQGRAVWHEAAGWLAAGAVRSSQELHRRAPCRLLRGSNRLQRSDHMGPDDAPFCEAAICRHSNRRTMQQGWQASGAHRLGAHVLQRAAPGRGSWPALEGACIGRPIYKMGSYGVHRFMGGPGSGARAASAGAGMRRACSAQALRRCRILLFGCVLSSGSCDGMIKCWGQRLLKRRTAGARRGAPCPSRRN